MDGVSPAINGVQFRAAKTQREIMGDAGVEGRGMGLDLGGSVTLSFVKLIFSGLPSIFRNFTQPSYYFSGLCRGIRYSKYI